MEKMWHVGADAGVEWRVKQKMADIDLLYLPSSVFFIWESIIIPPPEEMSKPTAYFTTEGHTITYCHVGSV